MANLRAVVGARHAEALMATGSRYTAHEAQAIGLVDEVAATPDDALLAAHLEMERWLSMPFEHTHWFVKDASRRDLTAMLETREQRAEDTLAFYQTLVRPEVQAHMRRYLASLGPVSKTERKEHTPAPTPPNA